MTNNNVAVDDGFDKFLQLPGELQCYVLSFIPARFLVRDVARTCRQMKGTIDAYVQRRITTALSVSSSSQQKTKQHHPLAAAFEDEPCTLMFEAQRPIDTLTSRHRLYYSHMEYAAVEESEDDESERYVDHVSTLQAHFTFLHAHDVDMNASTLSNDSNAAQPNAHDAYDGPSSYVQGRRGRRRTNTRTGARPWATWSEPVTSSLAAIERGRRRLNNDDGGGGGGAAGSADDLRSTSREASSRDASLARREAHYNVRGGGTLGAGSSGGGAASVRRPPTYRFQLDALDSFETWILSLTVQKLWWQTVSSPSPTTTTSLDRWQPRPMRWEKRVVEGLDRIFRDWFKPATTAVTATSATSALAIPDERELELDGQGCILRIQPHLNEHAGTHPALVSMSSHYYLSNAAAAATANTVTALPSSATYVDFTFHCTGIRLNAGRLLSVIEDIDLHVDRTRKQMNESNKSSNNTTAAMAASDEATSAAVVQQQTRSASDLDGLASTGFIVMSGRTSSGVSWSQAR